MFLFVKVSLCERKSIKWEQYGGPCWSRLERGHDTECGMGDGVGDSEHNSVLLFLSLFPLWQWLCSSLLSLACTELNLIIIHSNSRHSHVFSQSVRSVVIKYITFFRCKKLLSACLSPLLSLRIPASVLQWHYFKPSSHPLSLPSLALLFHSGQIPSSQDQAVPANLSPSQRHFQPLAGYPTSLPIPLLWPHPCQFWLITQSKRPLLPLWASHDLHARKSATERGRTALLSFSA